VQATSLGKTAAPYRPAAKARTDRDLVFVAGLADNPGLAFVPVHLQAPVVGAVVDGYVGQPSDREGVCRSDERKRCADHCCEFHVHLLV